LEWTPDAPFDIKMLYYSDVDRYLMPSEAYLFTHHTDRNEDNCPGCKYFRGKVTAPMDIKQYNHCLYGGDDYVTVWSNIHKGNIVEIEDDIDRETYVKGDTLSFSLFHDKMCYGHMHFTKIKSDRNFIIEEMNFSAFDLYILNSCVNLKNAAKRGGFSGIGFFTLSTIKKLYEGSTHIGRIILALYFITITTGILNFIIDLEIVCFVKGVLAGMDDSLSELCRITVGKMKKEFSKDLFTVKMSAISIKMN